MDDRSDAGEGELDAPRDPLLLIADPIPGPAMWNGLVPLLLGGFAVVREPVPSGGDGDRTGPFEDRAEWAERELLTRNVYPVHLIASGFAAGAAIRLARQRPELLRSLVLHAPIVRFGSGLGADPPRWSEVADAFAGVAVALGLGDSIGARRSWRSVLESGSRPPPAPLGVAVGADPGQLQWLRDWQDPQRWTVGAASDLDFLPPVLIVEGTEGPGFLHRIAGELARGFPNVTRLRLPAAGPLLPERDPHRFAAVLLSFCLERNVPTA